MRRDGGFSSFTLSRGKLLGALLPLPVFTPENTFADSWVVIAHPSITEHLESKELARIFTTRRQNGSSGGRIVPFNYPAHHPLRVAFDQAVLGMNPSEVASYWIDRKVRGGNPPPRQVASPGTIVKLVEKLDGAIAYVPSSALSSKVRDLGKVG